MGLIVYYSICPNSNNESVASDANNGSFSFVQTRIFIFGLTRKEEFLENRSSEIFNWNFLIVLNQYDEQKTYFAK